MKRKKSSESFDPPNPSRRSLLKTAAWAGSLSVTGGAMGLLGGCTSVPPEPESNEDLTALGVEEAIARIQQGELTAEDYVGQLLSQYRKHQDLNAVVTIDEARVLEDARAVDQARARGDQLGPLSGLPFVVKDQIDVAGYPTTSGNAALMGYVPEHSAPVVDTMIRNGGVVFAKTNLPDMVAGGNLMAAAASSNRFFGAVHNPYDTTRIPGGSSGGTAAALAARMVPAGLGEDTGGSVRFPAAFCGIAGLRPSTYTPTNLAPGGTPKRYADAGIVPPPRLLETIGPMARTVADVAFLDAIITGEAVPAVNLADVRIGIPRPDYWDNEMIDQGLAETMLTAFSRLTDAGAQLIEIDFKAILQLDEGGRLSDAVRIPRGDFSLWLGENLPGVTMEEVYAPRDVPDGGGGPGLPMEERIRIATEAASYYADVFESNGIAAVAFPTIPIPAPPINPEGERVGQLTMINGKMIDEVEAIVPNLRFGPRLGAPGLVIPAGLTEGLPVGLELEGLPGDDSRLLGLGIAVENVLGPIPPPSLLQDGA